MLTNDACVFVTVKVRPLLSVICQDCINLTGPDDRGNRSFTNNYLRFQCRLLLLVVGGAVPGASGADVVTATSSDTCFSSLAVAPHRLDLTLFYAGLCPLACLSCIMLLSGYKKLPYIPPRDSKHLQ